MEAIEAQGVTFRLLPTLDKSAEVLEDSAVCTNSSDNKKSMIIVNGEVAGTIPVLDRGLMYGDGVFRTMRVRGGNVELWDRQYAKLAADCTGLDILCPSSKVLEQEIEQVVRAEPECVLKIVISRGEGGRGYGLPCSVRPSRVVLSAPVPEYPTHYWEEGVRLHVCEIRMCHQPRLAGIKHLNRLENVLARMEWHDPDVPEGVMLDADGHVIEGTMCNIFARSEDKLVTPDLSQCGVAGLQRERIMAQADGLGLCLEVRPFELRFLLDADEVLVCNSVVGIWQVREIGPRTWVPGELVPALRRKLGMRLA
jgi:4-amino-4-deoxychorismate lyase